MQQFVMKQFIMQNFVMQQFVIQHFVIQYRAPRKLKMNSLKLLQNSSKFKVEILKKFNHSTKPFSQAL
jgi:hypothetical protein